MLFLRKVIKIDATRCLDFSSKCTKMRLAAGLRPDPLGELERSPRPPSRKRGPTSKGRGGKGRKGRDGRGEERRGGEGKGRGKGRDPPYHEILDPPLYRAMKVSHYD